MHRIDGAGATVDNKFTQGNPVTGVPATTVTDAWLNDVQEELISILLAAEIAPAKGSVDQVLRAMNLLNGRVVDSIAALRALDKTKNVRAFVTGYYTAGDGGGGQYRYDATDTTSADNGGSIIVATDGGRWKIAQSGHVSAKQFGAKGDGVADDTSALNNALSWCYQTNKPLLLPAGSYAVKESSPGAGYALMNRGVSMVGEGRFYSQIVALPSMPATADFICVEPNAGAYIDFLNLGRFSVQPTNGGTKYGKRAIFMTFQVVTNLTKLHMHDLYLLPGNDYSLEINNSIPTNSQGVPSNSDIERCYFSEGTKMIGIGDSNAIRRNIMRASGGGRCGLHLYMVDGAGGVASHTVIESNNIDCPGGALYAVRGRGIKFIRNNVELSAGAGTPNGAIVDIDGSSGVIPWAEVESNHIGTFGTATPTSAVRVNGAAGCSVDKNTILAGITVAKGIDVTTSAQDTCLGLNEIQSNYTAAVVDAGTGTRGIEKPVAPANGFTNSGGGYQPLSVFKGYDGVVTITGVVNAPASPNGIVIGTLPVGFRPASIQRLAVGAVVGGVATPQAVEIAPSGAITYFGSNSATRVEIAMSFQTQPHVIGAL